MSVFLQNVSSSRCQCDLCKCSQPARAFLVFDTVHTVMDSLGPRWNLSYYTLPATVHKFLLLYDHLKLQLCWFLIQYCNTTGSYFFTYFKWFYTENKHSISSISTRVRFRLLTGITLAAQAHGVRSAWMVLGSLLYFRVILVCVFVSAVREGVRHCCIIIGRSGIWTILSLFSWEWLMTVDPFMSMW
jgi:hypothetical protein